MISISTSARCLAAARRVDPAVSPAAVRAAVEAALAEPGRPAGGGPAADTRPPRRPTTSG